MKKLFIYLLLVMAMATSASAALTLGVGDLERPTEYWWKGTRPYAIGDQGLGWMKEVETQIEAWTLDGGTILTFPTNGGTFDNAADNIFEWNENSDELKWTFGSNKVAMSSSDVLEFSFGTIYIGMSEISAPAGDPSANNGWLYTKDDGGTTKLYFEDSTGTVTDILASASGNTLNAAYDQGGAGVGRTITADTGAFALTNTDADTAFLMTINAVPGSSAALGGIEITVGGNSTENAIEIENTGSGDDIQGTGDTWAVDKAGVGTFSTVNTSLITSTGTTSLGDGTGSVSVNSSSWDITTAGAASGLTTIGMSGDLTNSGGDVILANGKVLKGSITIAETIGVSAYDVDGAGYVATFTLTNANTIAAALGTGVETVAIDSTTWDVSTAGVFSGLTGLTVDGDSTFNDQIAVNLNANDEEILITGTATTVTADNLVEVVMAAQSTNTYILALTQTPNGDADNDYLICADTTGTGVVFKIENGGTTTWALDPASQIIIGSSANTTTDGAINIDHATLTSGSEAMNIKVVATNTSTNAQAIVIDLDDDITTGGDLVGVEIQSSDNDSDGTIIGLQTLGLLDVGWNAEVGAAKKAMTIDAKTVPNTGSTGVVDVDFESKIANAEAVHIEATFTTGAAGVTVAGMEIELVNDSGNSSDILTGLIINVTDSTATGTERGIYIKGTGIKEALQADFGYIRVGTGGTPTITPGDDDIYAEGTIEADGGFNTGTSTLKVATVDLTAQEVRALVATPIELVAAPSASEIIEFVSALLILDQAGDAFTEAGANDNLAIEYDGGSAIAVSETIEMTGFIDQSADMVTRAIPVKDPIDAAGDIVAKNLVLAGLDDELGGNAGNESALRVIITYRIVTALGL